jgi:hypothetical protein
MCIVSRKKPLEGLSVGHTEGLGEPLHVTQQLFSRLREYFKLGVGDRARDEKEGYQ